MASTILKPYTARKEVGPLRRFLAFALLAFVAVIYGMMSAILPPQLLTVPVTPILLLSGLVLWLLPDIGGISYDRMQKLLLAFVALSIVWPAYIAFNLPGLPWISLPRIALFILIAVFAFNYSTSSELRAAVADSVSDVPIYIRIFWALWTLMALSIVFSNGIFITLNKLINNQIYWTGVLFITTLLATRPGFVAKLFKVILYACVIMLVYSLYEAYAERVIWLDYLPPFLKIDPEIMGTLMDTQSRAGTDRYRVRGPFVTALYFSEFLTMVFPIFMHATVNERRFFPFVGLLSATFGLMVLMYFTDARSAMVGIVVVIALYPFYRAVQRRLSHDRSIVATGTLLAYPVFIVTLGLIIQFWQRAHVMVLGGGATQSSSNARDMQWELAIPKLATHPLGHGVGRGNEALGYFNPAGEGSVDSYFITILMDAGILALPLFLLCFLIPAWIGFNNFRLAKTDEEQFLAPLSLALINFVLVKSVLSSENTISLAFIYVGCIIGLQWQRNRRPAVTPSGLPAFPAGQRRPALTPAWQPAQPSLRP